MTTAAQAIAQTSLGQNLSSGEAEAVCVEARIRAVEDGSFLFQQGTTGDALYVILDGNFDVMLGSPETGTTVVATLNAGQVVGELEVMTQSLRIASIVAQGNASVLELPAGHFLRLIGENHSGAVKILNLIAKSLARRLAGVNQRIIEKTTGSVATVETPAVQVEPIELSTEDLMLVDDEDLEILDKLWS